MMGNLIQQDQLHQILSEKLKNYLYPQHYGHSQNYMCTLTDRWYPLYQSCKMVMEV